MDMKTAGLALALLVCGCETIDSVSQSLGGSATEPPKSAPAAATPVQPTPASPRPAPAPSPVTAPTAIGSSPLVPGFDCNDATWCLSVAANGDVSIGDPNGGDNAKMRPSGKNVLAGQANRQPRLFVVKCVLPDLLPQDSHICRGMDSYGNIYGGSVGNPASPTFFRQLTQAQDSSAPGIAALAPGFDCNDPTWCLGVASNGEVYIGNASGYEGGMRPAGKNVLANQANKQPRSFAIKCVATGTLEDAFICRGSDSLGNVYAGNSRNPANPNFFKVR